MIPLFLMMNSSTVYNIVQNQIKDKGAFENSHGINRDNINDYIILPYQKEFLNPVEDKIEKHWVVLDGNLNNNKQGYLIFYSEAEDEFGLGIKTNKKDLDNTGTFIGIYGSFINALEAM